MKTRSDKGTHWLDHPGDAELRRLYEEEKLSIRALGRKLSIGATTVQAWMKAAGIQSRSISAAKKGQKPAAHTIEASVRSRRKYALPGRPTVGWRLRPDGYIYVQRPLHPMATKSGYILEHRLIMAEHVGRNLLPTEDVHHINGDRADNRLENLELVGHAEHLKEHYQEREVCERGRFLPMPQE